MKAQTPRVYTCKQCKVEFERCSPLQSRSICATCTQRYWDEQRARYEAENIVRRRTAAEVLVELWMVKWDDGLSPRQHIALDGKIARQVKKVAKDFFAVWHEFDVLVAVVAYRRGILTQERWAAMRRLHPLGAKYKLAFATLFHEVTGLTIKTHIDLDGIREYTFREVEPHMPFLRRMFNDPSYAPPAQKDNEPSLEQFLDKVLKKQQERHGGRYGFLPSTRSTGTESPTDEPETDIEQLPHIDQERIDAAFVAIMGGFEL